MSLLENVRLARKGQYPMPQLIAEMQKAGGDTLRLWEMVVKTSPPLLFPKDPYGFWEAWSLVQRSTKMLLALHPALDSLLVGMHPYLGLRHPL